MCSRIQGHVRLFIHLNKLLGFFCSNDLDVGVDLVVELFLKFLALDLELLDQLSSGLFLLQLHLKGRKLPVKPVFLDVLAVDDFEGVVVESALAHHFEHLELSLHVFDFVLLVEQLHSLVAQPNQHVIEHHFLHVVVGGNVQKEDLAVAELLLLHSLLERNEGSTFIWTRFRQVQKQLFERRHGDEACAIGIVLGPNGLEVFHGLLLHGHVGQVSLAEEGVDDDGDEQVEEHLGDDHLEEQVESHGHSCPAPCRAVEVGWVSPICNNSVVVFSLIALVEDGPGLRRVEHDRVPSFASCASNQSQK